MERNASTALDHRDIDWTAATRARLAVTQTLEYSYPGPIYDLRQRLMLIPRRIYGDQLLIAHRLQVSEADAAIHTGRDGFGNRVHRIDVGSVEATVRFESEFMVERRARRGRCAARRPRRPASSCRHALPPQKGRCARPPRSWRPPGPTVQNWRT
jgi:transglutaminase-like putative cysteine protease